MVNSRNKGASFEREVAKLLEDELGVKFKRDLEQYRASDHGDLIANDPSFPLVIECKRYASGTGCRPEWWRQASAAAQALGKQPCVVYRYDRRPIRAVLGLSFILDDPHDQTIEMSIETLCYILREKVSTYDL